MVEQQRLEERLQQVHEIVVTTDVGELVCEDGFYLGMREPRQRRHGQQDHRFHPADDRRDIDT